MNKFKGRGRKEVKSKSLVSLERKVLRMSIHRILVPVLGHDSDGPTLEAAIQVARTVDARVETLFVRADPSAVLPTAGLGYSGVGIVAADIMDAVNKASDELAKMARDKVTTVAREAGVPFVKRGDLASGLSISFHQDTGILLPVLQHELRLMDLMVVGHGPQGVTSELTHVLPGLLLASQRPILITPNKPVEHIGRHIVVAWTSSDEAACALRQARGLLPFADTVEVVIVAEDQASAENELIEPLTYLASHGIRPQKQIIVEKTGNAGKTLLAYCEQSGADLLVMGAYGHSRAREFVLGGATREVLHQARLPVLMAH